MFHYDFSNHQNRFVRLEDLPEGYRKGLEASAAADPFYPVWHVAPPCGLLNDPCGLFEQRGTHYLFHQWFPAGPVHGLKHWRLLMTRDFMHYRDCGPVLTPGEAFDDHGCYTGMALADAVGDAEAGSAGATVFYTGIAGEQMEPSICEARFEGGELRDRHVIVARDPQLSEQDFRDPCVFASGGAPHMLVGSRSPEGTGRLLLFSREGDAWGAGRPLALTAERFDADSLGYMLECPNYYEAATETDGTDAGVLIFSPMGIESSNKYDFKNVFSVVYAVGERLDADTARFSCGSFYELDHGFDFYAPQVYRDGQGRRILFGWLGNSKSDYPTDANGWAHMLTCPRQLRVEGERLAQWPLEELEALRSEACRLSAGGCTIALRDEGPSLDLEGEVAGAFEWELGNEAGDCIRFSASADEYVLNRSGASRLYAEHFGQVRYARRLEDAGRVRLMLDHSSLELFLDGGKTVFTSRAFIDKPSYLRVRGIEGSWWPLAPIAVER